VGAGEGGEAADQDPVPAGAPDLPANLRRGAGTRREHDLAAVQQQLTQRDRLALFGQAIVAIRWGATTVGITLAAPRIADGDLAVALWTAVILAYTAFRTWRPIHYADDLRGFLAVLAEVLIMVGAVAGTDLWDSPFVFSLMTAVTVAGFASGFGLALRIAVASVAAVWIPDALTTDHDQLANLQVAAVVVLVAVVSGYARRISGETDRQHSLALDRLGRLADANALLFSLHRVAQTLPASLDLDEVIESTTTRLRDLFDFDVAAILLHDETDDTWLVANAVGARLPSRLAAAELPPPVRQAVDAVAVIDVPDLLSGDGPGLALGTAAGLYAVLPARGSVIGLIALEDDETGHFDQRDVDLLNGFVEPVALAVDNARWFARLRTVGAEEERTRIARDLHDRIGQSLAYLAFELDRIIKTYRRGDEVTTALEQLRAEVRDVVGDVRETLYDLRTDVTETADMATVLEGFMNRVRDRSNLHVVLRCQQSHRLPLLQEREMFRIAQEAVANVERHSNASTITATWWCDGTSAVLEVADDGTGFELGEPGRLDSYGILGMRERAASVGASLDVDSAPGQGTHVRAAVGSGDHRRLGPFRARRPSGP
jgi:signal transduction histidine kinase